MKPLSRILQQTKNGQLTVTFPREFVHFYDLEKGTKIYFRHISKEEVNSGEVDLEHGIFISWELRK